MPTSLWKNHDFTLLITGRTISQLGTAMTTFVIPWLFLQITDSATQTGIAFAVGFVPYIIIALPSGVWADRFNRKVLMMLSDSGRFVLLLSIPLTHWLIGEIPLPLLYIVQAGVSGLSAVFDAAYGASLPNIVASAELREANNTLQTSMSLSKMVGPVLGGVAVSWMGAANTILVDVGSYAISILSMYAITTSFSVTRNEAAQNTFIQDVGEGIAVVWRIKPIRYLMFYTTMVNLVGPGIDVALLFRIKHELALRSQWAGMIMMGLSGGMLLGALVNRAIGKRMGIGPWLTTSSLLLVFPPVSLSFIKSPLAILLVQIFIGVLLVAWNVQSVTLRQILIPNHLLGRGSSVFRLSAWISIPIGDAMAGIISQGFGTVSYFRVAACVLAVVAVLSLCTGLHRTVSSVTRSPVSAAS